LSLFILSILNLFLGLPPFKGFFKDKHSILRVQNVSDKELF
jgi:hypothetical protein